MAAEKAKKITSCSLCRNFKALATGFMPCKRCHNNKLYKSQTQSQKDKFARKEAQEEWRNSKKKILNNQDIHVNSDVYEAVVNKS